MDERDRVADFACLSAVLCPKSVVVVDAGRRPCTVGHLRAHDIMTTLVIAVMPHPS